MKTSKGRLSRIQGDAAGGEVRRSRKQLIAIADRLWEDFSRAIAPVVVAAGGTLDTIEKERLIVFLDSRRPAPVGRRLHLPRPPPARG